MKNQQETRSDYGLIQSEGNVELQTQGGTETSSLAVVEIVLRVSAALCAVGALVGAAVTLANVDDTFPDNPFPDNQEANELFAELEDDEEGYRAQATFVVFACCVGIVMQTLMVIIRGLYFTQKITKRFIVFAIVNTVSSTLLTLSFISGGVSSGANAADVQDYIDSLRCDDASFPVPPAFQEEYEDTCDDLVSLRDSMIASAVLEFIGGLLFAGLLLVMVITAVMKCKEKTRA